MAVNYYLADKNIIENKLSIKDKHSISGPKGNGNQRKPVVVVDYLGIEKDLIFTYPDTKKVDDSDSVKIKIRRGFLGFDITYEYDVIKKIN
ncbi:MAG: hypothetical protein QM763_10690 [Agriterribacter sp.]